MPIAGWRRATIYFLSREKGRGLESEPSKEFSGCHVGSLVSLHCHSGLRVIAIRNRESVSQQLGPAGREIDYLATGLIESVVF